MASNTNTTRASRSADTRENNTHRKPWKPPATLQAPPAPDGYKYRFIRAETLGKEDLVNMSKRTQEGYEVVNPKDINHSAMTMNDGNHAGVVGVGGLVLAKIPIETANEREAYYEQQTRNQLQAIDNDLMKESHPSMPMGAPTRSTQVEFGNPDNKASLTDKEG